MLAPGDACANFRAALRDDAVDGGFDAAVAEVEAAHFQSGAGGFDIGLLAFDVSLTDGDLKGCAAFNLLEFAALAVELRLAHFNRFLCGGNGGLIGSNGLDLGISGSFVLIVVGASDFLFVEEDFVAIEVSLPAIIDRLRFFQTGHGTVEIVLCGGEGSFRTFDVRFAGSDIAGVADLSDRQVGMRDAELGESLIVLRLGLLERDVVVLGIKFDEQFASLDLLIIIDINCFDGAVDARGNRVQVPVDLGVVGVFVAVGIEIPGDAEDQKDEENYPEDPGIEGAARFCGLGVCAAVGCVSVFVSTLI